MPTLRERADFTYGNTRLRARRETLLGTSLERLPHHDLDQLLVALDTTPYSRDIDAAHVGGLDRLHSATTTHLTRALRDTESLYQGAAREVVALVLRRWDGPNVTAVLRAAAGESPLPPLVDVGLVDAVAGHEAARQGDAVAAAALLVAWRLPGPHLARALTSLDQATPVAEIERRVLAAAGADLDDALAHVGPPATPVAALVRAERDLRATVLGLRLHEAVVAQELAPSRVAPVVDAEVPPVRSVPAATVHAAAVAPTRAAAVSTLTAGVPHSWQPALRAWADGATAASAEHALTGIVASAAIAGFATGDPLGAAIPTAWIVAKEDEARRLRHLGALASRASGSIR